MLMLQGAFARKTAEQSLFDEFGRLTLERTSRKRTLRLVEKHPTGGLLCAFMEADGTQKLVRVWSTKEMLKLLDSAKTAP